MKKLIALLLLLWAGSAFASTTTLTGTITDAQGNPLNGVLVMQLPMMAQDITTNTQVTVAPVYFRVVNGAITGGAPLYDVANLRPTGLYYITNVYDSAGRNVFNGNFYVSGATFNLGAATPTNITTSNVSFANPVFQSATITGALTAPNINNVLQIGCAGIGCTPTYACTSAGFNACLAALPTTGGSGGQGPGGTCDARACQGQITLNGEVDIGATNVPMKLILGTGQYNFTNTSGNGFKIGWSGSSLIGQGPLNTFITCGSGFTGDFVHLEPIGTANSIQGNEVAYLRIDSTNCPTVKHFNFLSVRDPSSLHNTDSRFWTGTWLNISTSTIVGANIPQGIHFYDVYAESDTATNVAHSVINTGNEMQFGPNFKDIITGNANGFSPIVIQPTATTNSDARHSQIIGASFACGATANSIAILITSPAGVNTGAQGNIIGPNINFENCTTGWKITGGDASHKASNTFIFGNTYGPPATLNLGILDFATTSKIWENTNGNVADITFTANSVQNDFFGRAVGGATDISDSGSQNSSIACQNVSGTNTCIFKGAVQAQQFQSSSANASASGIIGLANADIISWRNNANSGNNFLFMSTDSLTYNGSGLSLTGSPGKIATYGNLGTTGNGVASVQASTGAVVTGSGSSIGATSLCSTTQCPAGTYLVHAYLDITSACSTTGSYIVWLGYTDDGGAKTGSSTTTFIPINGLGVTQATGALALAATANYGQGVAVVRTTGAATGGLGSINYGTTATACGTGGPMVGKLYLDVTRLE